MTRPESPDGKAPLHKTRIKVNEALEKRLLAYAAGAGAVAAGLLSSAQPAEAEIIFTPTHVTLQPGQSFAIDIQGTTEFTLTDRLYVITGSFSTALFSVTAAPSAAVVGRAQMAAAMKLGAVVGPARPFQPGKALLAGAFRETQISQSSVFGQFANTSQRYLGLKFVIYGQVHYGWARFKTVKATDNPPGVIAQMTGYAFETRPNEPIAAGQTTDVSASLVLPEGATRTSLQPALGLLALGSAGLDVWRREEAD
jgi:hypothetical protein